ncbi:MAG: Multiple EGF-like-domain protein 3 [Parcubacteria group bacterium GW2011_GWA2_36_10]|nr:MAG: Multiple EGF-like-domain protein 3 [Parcubacteria group bacterium GW2011_GWA2_36_10]
MKKYYFIEDTFRNRMIVSLITIAVLSAFNSWFLYKDQKLSQAAVTPLTFFIDNSLTADCLVGTGNYNPSTRTCVEANTSYKAWRSPVTGLAWIKAAQTAGSIATGGHSIYFRAGTYRNYLTSEYLPSGVDARNNKVEAYQNEEVILSAAAVKTIWEEMGSGIYRTALGELNGVKEKDYRGVFEDGEALYSARYPEDYTTRLNTSSTTREFFIDCDLNQLTDEKILGSWFEVMNEHLWHKKAQITAYNRGSCVATFSTVVSENNFLEISSAPSVSTDYRLIDNINLLDSPGEYFYQITADITDFDYVSVWPISGEAPQSHLWEVAARPNALYFYTTATNNTHHLELRKLSFTGSGGTGIQVKGNTEVMANSYLIFDDLHVYNNAGSGFFTTGYNNHIIFKNSLVENNGAIGVNYQGPYSSYGYNIVDSQYYSVNSEIANNQFLNNVSCGSYTVYVKDLDIHENYYEGNALFNLNSALSIHDSSDVEVYDNHMFQNGGNGILLEGLRLQRVHRLHLHDNLIEEAAYLSPAWVTGIWLSDTDNTLVENNIVHTPNGLGLHIDSGRDNVAIYNQFLDIYDNVPTVTYAAVALENSDGTDPNGTWAYAINNTIAHNVFTGSFKYGLKVYEDLDDADGTSVRDNTVANNIFYSTSNSKVIPVSLLNDVDHSLNTYDNNIYYAPSASEVKFVYQSFGNQASGEYTFANYQIQSNQDSNSLNTNPLFTNFASNIFTLQSNSPAIDNAILLADINSSSYQGSGPDIGVFEYASGPVCGNNLIESGEQCDDGNTTNNDGCSSSCQTEQANPPPPVNPTCSDNLQNGNETGIDCGGSCTSCSNNPPPVNPPPPPEDPPIACGNNIQEQGEQCDDGNLVNNDGCSYLCQIEVEVTPTSTPTILEIDKLQGRIVKTLLDPKVYYINTNNQRYFIPNLNTFKSWFKNFNNLEIITPQTLASYEYKGRLTVKPGNLVQFKDSNKVYAVEPEKILRWITTGTIFKGFGYDFKKIISLPQEDFQYYTQGEDLSTSTTHPTGQLLKHGNFAPIFYLKDNIEYWIKDETTFLSLGFRWQDIITIPVKYWYTRILDNFSFRLKDR